MKTMFGVFSIYICFLFEVLSMKKSYYQPQDFFWHIFPTKFMAPVSWDGEGILEVILFPQ